MKRILLALALALAALSASAQTATPTPTATNTPTWTPSLTPTPTLTRTPSPAAPGAVIPLVISAGGTVSSALDLNELQSWNITIWAPATIDTSETVQVNYLHNSSTGWQNYQQIPGTDTTIAAAKTITITGVQCAALRILGGATAGAERVFYAAATRVTK